MKTNLSNKLKTLRNEKGISQEKLAQYLGVSFQAVSKWENGVTFPDIMLLPDIARFYGITVDELLEVEVIDEEKLFEEYSKKAYMLFCNGKMDDVLALWREAYNKMPNNIKVLEMLMSTYFDTDCVKYKDEIISIADSILKIEDAGSYYKGRAIYEAALTYHFCGDTETAELWAGKSYMIHSCMESILYRIYDGKDLLDQIAFYAHWTLDELAYMAFKAHDDERSPLNEAQKQDIIQAVIGMYESVYRDHDMPFETTRNLYNLYILRAEYFTGCGNETATKDYLERACAIAKMSSSIREHVLQTPILYGWHIADTPNPSLIMDLFSKEILNPCYEKYVERTWFEGLKNNCTV